MADKQTAAPTRNPMRQAWWRNRPSNCELVGVETAVTELLARPQSDRVILRNGGPIDAAPPDYRELDGLLAQ